MLNGIFDKPRSQKSVSGRRLLVIDDDARGRYALALVLRSDGYEVHTASGHEDWLDLFHRCLSIPATWVTVAASTEPDAILLDWTLRDGMALHVLGELKGNALTKHIPVAVLMPRSDQGASDVVRSMGANVVDVAPMSRLGLGAELRRLFDKEKAPARPTYAADRPEIFPS